MFACVERSFVATAREKRLKQNSEKQLVYQRTVERADKNFLSPHKTRQKFNAKWSWTKKRKIEIASCGVGKSKN